MMKDFLLVLEARRDQQLSNLVDQFLLEVLGNKNNLLKVV
jgi:hypothetical protein